MLYTNISYITLPLQASELVVEQLKQLRKLVNTSLADNIPHVLTLDIWTFAANDSYLSCTFYVLTKEFMLQTYSMGALPFNYLSHD